jgi:hypothetical protein
MSVSRNAPGDNDAMSRTRIDCSASRAASRSFPSPMMTVPPREMIGRYAGTRICCDSLPPRAVTSRVNVPARVRRGIALSAGNGRNRLQTGSDHSDVDACTAVKTSRSGGSPRPCAFASSAYNALWRSARRRSYVCSAFMESVRSSGAMALDAFANSCAACETARRERFIGPPARRIQQWSRRQRPVSRSDRT